jgi:hypothetical protein
VKCLCVVLSVCGLLPEHVPAFCGVRPCVRRLKIREHEITHCWVLSWGFKLLILYNAMVGSTTLRPILKNAVHQTIVPNASHMLPSLHAVHTFEIGSDLVVVEDEVDISRPLRVVPDEVLVSWRSLLLRVAREHALQTDADALHVVYGAPAGSVEKVEADDAVGVNVRVPRYWVCVVLDEDYFGSLVHGQL